MGNTTQGQIQHAHPVDIYVGERVRLRRKTLSLSQSDLAAQLGLTFQQVQKYERGSNRISASRLFEIAQALQVPIAWFFEGMVSPDGAATVEPANDLHGFLHAGEAVDLARAFLAIKSDLQRQTILNLLKSMGSESYKATSSTGE